MLNLYIASVGKKNGKTFVTAGLGATMQSLGYSTSIYKPIQTSGIEINGFMQSPDLTYIKTIDPYINTHFTYLYKTNEEPLIASESENEFIDIELINTEYQVILSKSECTLLEGDSGLLSPLAPNVQNIDLIKRLQIPLLFVIKPDENIINETLSAIYIAQDKGVNVRGVIINDIEENCSKSLLNSIPRIVEEYSNAKILGLIPHLSANYSPEDLITATLNGIDIESVFDVKIEKLDLS